MKQNEFDKLSSDLRQLAARIPLKWGRVQNNRSDDQIDLFSIHSYAELEAAVSQLRDEEKNYLRRRWFMWKCSACDEFLFYRNPNTQQNPDPYDKEYDILIAGKYKFDVKGTVIPKEMRDRAEELIRNPEEMIGFFYDRQSTGRRYGVQNRLFIVHHSFVSKERELYLRCAWGTKQDAYARFCDSVDRVRLFESHGVTAAVIFLLEREKGVAVSEFLLK